jgi:hypothetical protein
MKKKQTTWYIFTNDSYTNEVISRELPEENAYNEVLCSDKIRRMLWQCDDSFVIKMDKNKEQKNLDFTVFKKDGKDGDIKEVAQKFYPVAKISKPKEARAYKAGKDMGLSLIETIHLLYQNNTAKNYISGLVDVLIIERNKRISTEK